MVLQDVLKWSGELHNWQKDALRRLCLKELLDAEDTKELLAQIKKEAGLSVEAPQSIPLDKSHFSGGTTSKVVKLKEIKNIKNVNALMSDASLKFKPDGLTVIYGPNGSGKTGFIRILRSACRTRIDDPKKLEILANVYGKDNSTPKEAEILIEVEGKDTSLSWTDSSPALEELTQAAVFDTHAANLYVDKGNQIRFLPFGLNLPYKLISISVKLNDLLRAEKKEIDEKLVLTEVSRFPDMETKGKSFYDKLGEKTTDQLIEENCIFSPESKKRLEEIHTVLASNTTRLSDIQSLVKWCQGFKLEVENFTKIVSDAGIDNLKTLKKNYLEAEAAALFAAKNAFKNEPVKGVGTDTWERLWNAARDYSESLAYPGKAFPVIEDDTGKNAQCVLCQQELGDEAKKRFGDFFKFVTGNLNTAAEKAKNIYENQCLIVRGAKLLSANGDDIRLQRLESSNKELFEGVNNWVTLATKRMGVCLKLIDSNPEEETQELPAFPDEHLESFIEALENEKKEIESTFDTEKKAIILKEKAELESKKILFEEKANLKKRRDLLSDSKKTDKAIALTNTRNITIKASEFVDSYLTASITERFDKERENFDISHVSIALKREAARTGANFKTTTQSVIECNASDVLSEGEQKALALSAFFTETHVISPNGAIVFDDPVSSLDRKRSTRVAKRLVEEAKTRQVIVFTHDLIFYGELCGIAEKENIDPQCISIVTNKNGSGYNDPAGKPWDGMSVNKRLNVIRNEFISIKKLYEYSPSKYGFEIKNLYGRLRDVYERAVEEKIFNGVVVRYNFVIETKKLRYVDFSDDLAKSFYDGMTKANTYSHDNAQAGNVPIPEPEEFEKDLAHMVKFLSDLDTAYKACEKRRDYMK